MTKQEAIEYGIRWKNAIIDRGDTENSEAVQFLSMTIEALEQEPSCRNTRHVDLISRQAAIDALYDKGLSMTAWGEVVTMKWSDIQKCIEQLPSAEPKRGEWVQAKDVEIEYAVCTNCTHHGEFYMRYCPNCGAKMGGEEEDAYTKD